MATVYKSEELRRTPLYDTHVALGGKIVPFAGWELPVQYSGVIAEHRAVREAAGLFDVSHMGEIFVEGPEAEAAIDELTCNDVKTITDGKGQYNAIINMKGGVVDDIIVYRYSRERYLICVNASNADKDFAWFSRHNKRNAKFINRSAEFGQIALQGPHAVRIMERLVPDAGGTKYFHFRDAKIGGTPVILARTGYTGEDGFEVFIPWADTVKIWNSVMEAGNSDGLVPAGLGARDSLRLEACYPLHGHELGDDITAIESGLGWIVKPDKGDFTAREILKREKQSGAKRSLIGYFIDDAGIARQGDKILSASGDEIGVTTSGTKTPTVNKALGLALVDAKYAALDTKLNVVVRERKLACHVVKRPFYKRAS